MGGWEHIVTTITEEGELIATLDYSVSTHASFRNTFIAEFAEPTFTKAGAESTFSDQLTHRPIADLHPTELSLRSHRVLAVFAAVIRPACRVGGHSVGHNSPHATAVVDVHGLVVDLAVGRQRGCRPGNTRWGRGHSGTSIRRVPAEHRGRSRRANMPGF